jgi:hypothetical protein
MKIIELNEITGEIETHNTFECAHCDEPSERHNGKCFHCQKEICPCCSSDTCPNHEEKRNI